MKSKKITSHTSLVTLILLLAFLSSCNKDFLERNPLDQVTEETFYKTAEDAQRAIKGTYSALAGVDWHGKCWMIQEIPSDNTTVGGNDPDFSPIDNFTLAADNGPVLEYWREHFRLITLSNQIIERVPAIDMNEETRASIVAEAKFLRAYAYFDLVRIYGGVPLITTVPDITTNLLMPRSSVDEVYQLIEEDLLVATSELVTAYSGSDVGRATRGTAKALLAKVYLTIGKYDEAMDLCRQVIASGQYRLMEDYGDLWLKETSDNNAEAVFQVQYVGCAGVGIGNACQAFFAPWGQGITKNSDGWGSQVPTSPTVDNPGTTIRDALVDPDLRRYETYMKSNDEYPSINAEDGGYEYPSEGASRTLINIKKYVIGGGPDVCFMSTPQNYNAIRYADVLLTLAEASCRRNGGISITPDVLEAFNSVRTRAGLSVLQNITTEQVMEERRKEFAFENQRWFDLLRMDNIREVMQLHGKQMQDFHKLFPIPQSEIDINPELEQNPGYN
ncbi:MAG: RagB/SusD family nutrient uptake outer membrane protein [Bacteroidota bacterium]